MAPGQFKVNLEKEQHVFSAAHFITFNGNICERLHGHNYRVKCEVTGPLDENEYVIDFIALRDTLSEIILELDHRVLLPTKHSKIIVIEEHNEVTARFEDRRWVFPRDDCRLLPIANTTAERLAWFIAGELKSRIPKEISAGLTGLTVAVDENHGQWASCETTW